MEKKEFQSSFSDYTDTSNCGLETERRTEKGFEAYVYDESMRIINRNAHSATVTDIVGVCATGSEISNLGDLRGIVRGYLSCFFNKCNLYGYTYSKDHKLILVSEGSKSWTVYRDDISNMCDYATTGNMTPVIMRSIIECMNRNDVSARMYDLMVEYALG